MGNTEKSLYRFLMLFACALCLVLCGVWVVTATLLGGAVASWWNLPALAFLVCATVFVKYAVDGTQDGESCDAGALAIGSMALLTGAPLLLGQGDKCLASGWALTAVGATLICLGFADDLGPKVRAWWSKNMATPLHVFATVGYYGALAGTLLVLLGLLAQDNEAVATGMGSLLVGIGCFAALGVGARIRDHNQAASPDICAQSLRDALSEEGEPV